MLGGLLGGLLEEPLGLLGLLPPDLLEELPELEGLPRDQRDEEPDEGLRGEDVDREAIIFVLSISSGNVWPLT